MYCTVSCITPRLVSLYFFFNDPPPTEIYTLSLHDALPISRASLGSYLSAGSDVSKWLSPLAMGPLGAMRSEEHTSELQSHSDLVCRLLLEKKKRHALDRTGGAQRGPGHREPARERQRRGRH